MEAIDIDAIISDLKARVVDRRATGDYPVGLEEQLEAEFKVIMAAVHRDDMNTTELGRRVKQVEVAVAAVRAHGDTTSRMPGGGALHSTTARLVGRHTGMIAETVRALGYDIAVSLHEIHHLFDLQGQADERQLNEVLASVTDRLAVLDHVADSLVLLEQRVAALESAAQTKS